MRVLRRRRVRMQQLDPAPTIEGILIGKPWRSAGHYVVLKPGLLQSPGSMVPLDGSKEVWVPRERVVFVEVLK